MKIILKFTNYERDTSTHLHCKLQKIPPKIIESKTLYNDLIKLENTIKKRWVRTDHSVGKSFSVF